MRRLLLPLTLAPLLTGCQDDSVTRAPGAAVSITIADYRYTPQNVSVRAGQVFFAVRNAGTDQTNLTLTRGDTEVGRIATLEPGEFGSMTVRLEPGEYEMASSVGKHAVLGEYGSLTVRAGS